MSGLVCHITSRQLLAFRRVASSLRFGVIPGKQGGVSAPPPPAGRGLSLCIKQSPEVQDWSIFILSFLSFRYLSLGSASSVTNIVVFLADAVICCVVQM